MERVPVYFLHPAQGVPIPDSKFFFEATKKQLENFRTTLSLHLINKGLIETAVIACYTGDKDLNGINTQAKLLDIVSDVHCIGVLCEITSIHEEKDSAVIACDAIARVYVQNPEYQDGTIYTPLDFVPEQLLPQEEDIIDDIKSLVQILTANRQVFDDAIIEQLLASRNIIHSINVLANVVLTTETSRIRYIQYEDNLERFNLILKKLVKIVQHSEDKLLSAPEPPPIATRFKKLNNSSKTKPSIRKNSSTNPIVAAIAEIEFDPDTTTKIQRELDKLESTPSNSLEYSVLLEYLTWIHDIPWQKYSYKKFDLKNLLSHLNQSHYGLEDVKTHILEYATIEQLRNAPHGATMCFVGAPGTGKTTLAREIGVASNRQVIHMALGGLSDEAELRGHRRAQPLHSKILTPSGWTNMGNLEIGDIVCTPDGKEAPVIGIYPQGKKPIYKVTFSDGASTECCADHLWSVQDREERERHSQGKVLSLKEIMCLKDNRPQYEFSIPLTQPLEMQNNQELPLEPYLLGVLIGNECGSDPILISSDQEIIDRCKSLLGYEPCTRQDEDWLSSNKVKHHLMRLELWGHTAKDKFIPHIYTIASLEQRIALLQGLIDTHGHISKRTGRVVYSTISNQLKEDVIELVGTLGGRCTVIQQQRAWQHTDGPQEGEIIYHVNICLPNTIQPCSLSSKLDNHKPIHTSALKRYLSRIEMIGEKEAQCIAIDHPDHLYITDDYIVTHNTYVSSRPGRIIAGLKQAKTMDPLIILDEVDKMSHYKGDPSSGLLEILDPAQNNGFIDRYLEIPVDLSRAVFICTANYEDQIPAPLKDRMELIHFRDYTKEERQTILTDFLIPKATKEYNLNDYAISFTDEILDQLSETTQVREINTHVKKLLRMAAVRLILYEDSQVLIDLTFGKKVLHKKPSPTIGFSKKH